MPRCDTAYHALDSCDIAFARFHSIQPSKSYAIICQHRQNKKRGESPRCQFCVNPAALSLTAETQIRRQRHNQPAQPMRIQRPRDRQRAV